MYSLIYYSKAEKHFHDQELTDLVLNAECANQKNNIKGFITYHSGYFVQYIEGYKSDISALFDLIKNDGRHSIIDYLVNENSSGLFNQWNMHHINTKELNDLNLEYFLLGQFNLVNKGILTLDAAEDFIWHGVKLVSKEHIKQLSLN